jgi:hypothetical protein
MYDYLTDISHQCTNRYTCHSLLHSTSVLTDTLVTPCCTGNHWPEFADGVGSDTVQADVKLDVLWSGQGGGLSASALAALAIFITLLAVGKIKTFCW